VPASGPAGQPFLRFNGGRIAAVGGVSPPTKQAGFRFECRRLKLLVFAGLRHLLGLWVPGHITPVSLGAVQYGFASPEFFRRQSGRPVS
jgi:hypothetical protein